ncbi:hypothetical protein CH063_03851, partial [Colletotrichum higginsianum]
NLVTVLLLFVVHHKFTWLGVAAWLTCLTNKIQLPECRFLWPNKGNVSRANKGDLHTRLCAMLPPGNTYSIYKHLADTQ